MLLLCFCFTVTNIRALCYLKVEMIIYMISKTLALRSNAYFLGIERCLEDMSFEGKHINNIICFTYGNWYLPHAEHLPESYIAREAQKAQTWTLHFPPIAVNCLPMERKIWSFILYTVHCGFRGLFFHISLSLSCFFLIAHANL